MVTLQDIHDKIRIVLDKKHKQLSTYVLLEDVEGQRITKESIRELDDILHSVVELSESVKATQWQR